MLQSHNKKYYKMTTEEKINVLMKALSLTVIDTSIGMSITRSVWSEEEIYTMSNRLFNLIKNM